MTVVTSRVVNTSGAPVPGVFVYAWLVASSTALTDGARVAERVDTYTDRDGRWHLELPPASTMADPAAVWAIREIGYDAYRVPVPDDHGHPVDAGAATTVPGEPPTGGDTGASAFVLRSQLAAPGGVATLDAARRVPVDQLPVDDLLIEWHQGDGPPDVIVGASRGDLYIDRLDGALYRLD